MRSGTSFSLSRASGGGSRYPIRGGYAMPVFPAQAGMIPVENTGKEVRVGKQSISIYEIGYAKRMPASPLHPRPRGSRCQWPGKLAFLLR